MSLFVDSSVWFAASDSSERRHGAAASIVRGDEPLVTSDHVVAETWGLLQRRFGWSPAERWWEELRATPTAVELVGVADFERAWEIGEHFADQGFSIVDRTSFAVMQRLGIARVATFDHHFSVYRYGPARNRAFTVVP